MAMDTRIGTNGDIRVAVDGGANIGVHVGTGGMESLGKLAFNVGVAEGSSITIDGDYRKLRNIPTINGVKIIGDLSLTDLTLRSVYYDTTENFDAQGDVISKEGALYIYSDYIDYVDDDGTRITIPGIRVGDGKTPLKDLQFAGAGASSGGTTNYNALRNKPKINGVTLEGNVELEDLSLKAVFYASKEAWDQQATLIPPEGDIFIISDFQAHTDESGITTYTPAIKIGDGVTPLGDLKEIKSYDATEVRNEVVSYLDGIGALVSELDRAKWNGKRLKVRLDPMDDECLQFYYE